ncbi:glycosyltransferase [Paenibacillus pinistramenti]|uniref:glycosyltransferase n=1 Tax=Paenibacillus pinistramenti TaxID=1768003 RepID=UPI0011087C20|nr:glycosyltransferase [Paenibacillus pinistramenti]
MIKIALVMIVKNEETVLERCLKSAASMVDEIIIVDTGSTDQTKQIAEKWKAQVYDFEWTQDFSLARNFGLQQSTADWNLILDADEYIHEADWEKVKSLLTVQSPAEFVGRITIVNETIVNGEFSKATNRIPRLLPAGVRFQGKIHEQISEQWRRVDLPITVHHDGYLNQNKSARNIPILEQELKAHPESPYYCYQLAKEFEGTSDYAQAKHYYEKAYKLLSGKERYAPNVVVAYLYVLIKLGQLEEAWDIIQPQHSWLQNFPDYHFVCGIFYLDWIMLSPEQRIKDLPLIEKSYLRCLEIGETAVYDSVEGTGSYAALYNLGNYYEVLGMKGKAVECFQKAANLGYEKAKTRLNS